MRFIAVGVLATALAVGVLLNSGVSFTCNFFVDGALTTGANDGSSWANAWRTFSAVSFTGISPGQTLCISGGATSLNYGAQTLTVGKSGTPTSPISIRVGQDSGHNGVATIDYGGDRVNTATTAISLGGFNYIYISGDVGGSNHLRIQNLYSSTNDTNTAGIGYYAAGGTTGVTIDHVAFDNVGNSIRINTPTQAIVSNNTFDNGRGDVVIGLVDASGGAYDTNLVYGNTLNMVCNGCITGSASNNGPDGIQDGNGMSIFNNTITMNYVSAYVPSINQHPDMIQNHGAQYMKIYNNTFTNVGDSQFDWDMVDYGMASNCSPHDVYIYNNVFRIVKAIDPEPEQMRIYDSCAGAITWNRVQFSNNLFIDDPGGSTVAPVDICNQTYAQSCGTMTVDTSNFAHNNIFYNEGSATQPMFYVGAALPVTYRFGSGVYYTTTNVHCAWRGGDFVVSGYISANDASGVSTQPAFVEYAAGNYHLSSTDTTAANNAIAESVYSTDKDGVSRPQGKQWDRGPYERPGG